ncbi:MAG: hypothetical protein LC808_28020, partial [Actinobacteria bacterium]|nr:hypothetical protein [Actinomycetota bacterium]
ARSAVAHDDALAALPAAGTRPSHPDTSTSPATGDQVLHPKQLPAHARALGTRKTRKTPPIAIPIA